MKKIFVKEGAAAPPAGWSFTWTEFSGSLGDLGLFIPLVVAMTVLCGLDIGVVLIWAGVMNVATGWIFRQPIPVQPMKAIAAVVIAEGLPREALTAAGIGMGAFLLILSFFTEKIVNFIPRAIVRGIQLGTGVKLILQGSKWLGELPFLGWDSLGTAVLAAGFLIFFLGKRQPALLYVFLLGFILQYRESPGVFSDLRFAFPHFQFDWPPASVWGAGLLKGALPQIPLTLLNSVVAVCALSADYFPGRGIAPRKMAVSVGLMNLCAVPWGGIPMCHGSGGLAAQYRFGARTGASVVMLGILKILAGLAFGGAILQLLKTYPMSILGVMLIFAGAELAKAARDVLKLPRDTVFCLVTAVFIVVIDTLAGFLIGSGFFFLERFYQIFRQRRLR